MKRRRTPDPACQRITDEMRAKRITQRDLAAQLKWSQSRVGKTLTGITPLTVDALRQLSEAVGISPVEAVRDPGLEFVADLTPLELRVIERFRLETRLQDAVCVILQVKTPTRPERYAKAPHNSQRLPRPPASAAASAAVK